ncbi:hypothetical protein [Cytophaga sp. FL35]|uniref:hypothetical protein n=1 Tax=Cytophaga sp. FL35 TaxID=1904456 RepID=UPI001653A363|nr:hypothetical protein [Cytophaga sp. FL35]MBC7000852.1 hypothetical protein [Cytophaga sp. FL35]
MKKESLKEFLQNLTDREIAFFFKYRRTELMPESQEKIQSEIENRNLTDFALAELTKPIGETELENCPRCGSNLFQEIKETELRSTKYGGYEVEINSRKCRICSYNPQMDKPINWKVRLDRFLGKYSWTKLK